MMSTISLLTPGTKRPRYLDLAMGRSTFKRAQNRECERAVGEITVKTSSESDRHCHVLHGQTY
jgi:hypothetical protein